MNSKNELEKIINNLSFFKNDMNIRNWDKLELDFSSPNLKSIVKVIKEKIGNKTGFYAIFDEEECLYIGIGRPVWKRVKSHYYSSQGLEKVLRWSMFFQANKKRLTIYHKEFYYCENKRVEDSLKRLIESVLEQEYKPKFEFGKDK